MTYDCAHNYTWEAAGKMHSVDSTTLTYDALGRMVEMYNGSTYTEFVFSPMGARFATMHGQTLVKAFVPLPTGATAVYTTAGLAYYRHTDHLGSSRLATNPNRTLHTSIAYSPFGETYAQNGEMDTSFTGIGQDLKTGLYDFQDRENSAAQGRWISPDPAGLSAVNMANPQSWNRYAYVMNNPMSLVDPLGDDAYEGCSPTATPWCYLAPVDLSAYIWDPFAWMTGTTWESSGEDWGHNPFPFAMAWVDGSGSFGGLPQSGQRDPCAASMQSLGDNARLWTDAQGQDTLTLDLTGSKDADAFSTDIPNVGTLSVVSNTTLVASVSNGSLNLSVNNPIYLSVGGGTGAYISSITFSNGRFNQVNGAVSFLGIPFGSTATSSGYLQSKLDANSALVNAANLLQGVLQLNQTATDIGRLLNGCK